MNVLKRATLLLSLVIGGIFAVNALVLFAANPVSIQGGDKSLEYKYFSTVEVRSVENLRSGGLGKASFPVFGYVNMTDEKDIIYLNQELTDKNPHLTHRSYFYKHEMAHIYQKRMVAEKVGGYPSYLNPVKSYNYYRTLFKLDREYQKYMPDFNKDDEFSLFPGLETAAECFAQPQKINPSYEAHYVKRGYCVPEERKHVFGMVVGRWPAPLTEEQKEELKKSNSIWELPYTVMPQNAHRAV